MVQEDFGQVQGVRGGPPTNFGVEIVVVSSSRDKNYTTLSKNSVPVRTGQVPNHFFYENCLKHRFFHCFLDLFTEKSGNKSGIFTKQIRKSKDRSQKLST